MSAVSEFLFFSILIIFSFFSLEEKLLFLREGWSVVQQTVFSFYFHFRYNQNLWTQIWWNYLSCELCWYFSCPHSPHQAVVVYVFLSRNTPIARMSGKQPHGVRVRKEGY